HTADLFVPLAHIFFYQSGAATRAEVLSCLRLNRPTVVIPAIAWMTSELFETDYTWLKPVIGG
ncbi:MAG: hypothetical protein AAF764_05625, partial [Pseudomonadota bacterium]